MFPFIKFVWLKPKEWNIIWDSRLKFLYIGFYFFAVRIDFGRKYREEILKNLELLKEKARGTKTAFETQCAICKRPMIVTNGQIAYQHSKCKKLLQRRRKYDKKNR